MPINIIKKLPIELVNIIIPYTYNIQDKQLLLDIKSFSKDIELIKSVYYTQYNEHVLLFDLLQFLYLYKDEIKNTYKNLTKLYVSNLYYKYNKIRNKSRIINLIISFLSPLHRTRFINEYIIDE